MLPCLIVVVCLFYVPTRSASVFAFQNGQPSEEQEPALPEQTSLTHGKIFVKLLLEGSNATNYLRGASQPSHWFDRWLWPQQTWGPSLGWHIRLLWKGEVDGLRWGFVRCKAYSQIASCTRQARTGKLPWWHRSVRPCNCSSMQFFSKTITHTVTFFFLMIGFITCSLLGLKAQPYSSCAVSH